MNSSDESVKKKMTGKCLLDNWVEERATAALDDVGPKAHIHKHGHRGILSVDLTSKVQDISTLKEGYPPPRGPGVRQRGIREELFKQYLYKKISEQVHEEQKDNPCVTEFVSTTREDFKMEGFKPDVPSLSLDHDYKTEQAISFWSENHKKIQGTTAVRTKDTQFNKNATFSTPISEQLYELS